MKFGIGFDNLIMSFLKYFLIIISIYYIFYVKLQIICRKYKFVCKKMVWGGLKLVEIK